MDATADRFQCQPVHRGLLAVHARSLMAFRVDDRQMASPQLAHADRIDPKVGARIARQDNLRRGKFEIERSRGQDEKSQAIGQRGGQSALVLAKFKRFAVRTGSGRQAVDQRLAELRAEDEQDVAQPPSAVRDGVDK